jgi:hypothetical protein
MPADGEFFLEPGMLILYEGFPDLFTLFRAQHLELF